MMKNSWNHSYQDLGDLTLHYVEKGSGKLLIMLHGFPDFWYTWRHQITALSKTYRVVAPDLRGYNKSDKPIGVDKYHTLILSQDITALIEALGESKAIIVGHDWGGAVAWNIAMMAPDYVEKLVILNCPHPIPLVEAFWGLRFRQLQKSWYIFLFQLMEGPEEVLSKNNYEALKKMLRESTRHNLFSEEELKKYVESWSQPGALTASINYYRANWNLVKIMTMTKERQEKLKARTPKVKCPTLVIWGEKDIALDKSLTKGMEKYIESSFEIKFLAECGHWAHLEEPNIVNEYILSFVK